MPWPWIGGFCLGVAFCAFVALGLVYARLVTQDTADDDGFWEQW